MKRVGRIFITFFLLTCVAFANEYRDIKKISLQKDEQKKILVKYGSYERLFKFRWTLYTNGGLVIFRSYDRKVAQNILYLNGRNQSFKLELKARGADYYQVPYILVKFKNFNYETNQAEFELFLSDDKMQLELQELKNS